MPIPPFASELIGQIVDAIWESTSTDDYPRTAREEMLNLTSVSRSFYVHARRYIWRKLNITYQSLPTQQDPKHAALYEILSRNRFLLADIREVAFVIKDVYNPQPQAPKLMMRIRREPSKHVNPLAMALGLLSTTGKMRTLTVYSQSPSSLLSPSPSRPRIGEDSILFALTALRLTPSLKTIALNYIRSPPPALLFGHPGLDAVEFVQLDGVDFPAPGSSAFRDYIISQDAALSLHLSESSYRNVVQAISCFSPPPTVTQFETHILPPLLPKATRVQYSICDEADGQSLVSYVSRQRAIDTSKPLGGHLPLLNTLECGIVDFESLDANSHLNHDLCIIGHQLTHLKISQINSYSTLDDTVRFPALKSLTIQIDPAELDLDSGYRSRPNVDPSLGTVLRLLDLISPSTFPSLEVISLEMIVDCEGSNLGLSMSYLFPDAEQEQELYYFPKSRPYKVASPNCWTLLDASFVNLSKRLAPRRIKILFKLFADWGSGYGGWEAAEIRQDVLDWDWDPDTGEGIFCNRFPRSMATDGIRLWATVSTYGYQRKDFLRDITSFTSSLYT